MELNWTTFILEIINFLVLIWLLKRFLYKPVSQAIEKRRQAIEEDLASAREKNELAQQLLAQQQQQLADWENTQQQARQELQHTIDAEREKKLAAMEAALADDAKRGRAIAEHQKIEQWKILEQKALATSGRFASQLLSRFSGPELEKLLINAAIDDLSHLPPIQQDKLRQALANSQAVQVSSVYSIDPELQQRLLQALQSFVPQLMLTLYYSQDASLVSGLALSVDCFEIHANLAHELRFFSEGVHSG